MAGFYAFIKKTAFNSSFSQSDILHKTGKSSCEGALERTSKAVKRLAGSHGRAKDGMALPVCAATVGVNGSRTCLEQEKEVFEESICYQ